MKCEFEKNNENTFGSVNQGEAFMLDDTVYIKIEEVKDVEVDLHYNAIDLNDGTANYFGDCLRVDFIFRDSTVILK